MKVLIACEYSGTMRDAFIQRGFDAISCDLLPTDVEGPHIQGDVRDLDLSEYDLLIGHPDCTYLCNSGVSHLHKDPSRWDKLDTGAAFLKYLLDADVPYKAIENPIPHKYAVERIGRKYDQLVQPWQFGHGETKATCFWLEGLPKLTPTDIVEGREPRLHKLGPSKNRWKIRSTTFKGIAEAAADQWGNYVFKELYESG